MDSKVIAKILLALSIVYGMVVAILAVLDVPGMSIMAMVGGMIVGGAWALWGVFGTRANKVSKD